MAYSCRNCGSIDLGSVSGTAPNSDKVYPVICWNCGEIGQWKKTRKEAIDSWNRGGGGWEGPKGVVNGA